jgi:hypothetical protein
MKLIRLSTHVVGIFTFALFFLGTTCRRADAQQQATDVVAMLKDNHVSFKNVFAVTRWVEVWDGIPKSWERQRWTWDNLGRRRLCYQHGIIDKNGQDIPHSEALEIDSVYDGEVVLDQKFYPNRDRLGGNDDNLPKGYRAAIVSDAGAPTRQSLESHRNPLEYLRNVVMRELEDSLSKKNAITARNADKMLELSYAIRDANSSAVRSIILIDPNRKWSLLRWTTFDSSNKIIGDISVNIKDSNGQWIATEGSHKYWGDRPTNLAPVFDWQFKVTEFVLNDPNFDNSAFAVRLLPDTAVSDIRFTAVYRIGAHEESAANLVKLAEAARAEEEARRKLISSTDRQVPARRSRFPLLLINLAAIATITIFILLRRKKSAK